MSPRKHAAGMKQAPEAPTRAADVGGQDFASSAMVAATSQTAREAYEAWLPRLQSGLEGWISTLPEDVDAWKRGLVYVRESSARSLHGSAPDVQLRSALGLAAQKQVQIPVDGLYFDVESGTDTVPRRAFRRLYERCLAGGYEAVVVSAHDRMFRNVEQAKETKREFRRHGVELVYSGMYEGDERDPTKWQADTFQEFISENHARITSWNVGKHFETLSRDGRPLGQLPEAYRGIGRGPSVLGHAGPVIGWEFVEPLASIIKEGAEQYLAGLSLNQLAKWSATTDLRGVTPGGIHMSLRWWYGQLRNPKYAGYQIPTTYRGYKFVPGKDGPRVHVTRDTPLVPCKLPALWDLDTYYRLMDAMTSRHRAPKRRQSYRAYLLTSISYDALCGHRMQVTSRDPSGKFSMVCVVNTALGKHSTRKRADVAERELEALLANLSFDDPTVLRQVEDELRRVEALDRHEQERFRPNPAIGAVRVAIDTLESAGVLSGRTELERQLADLEAADVARRDAAHEPLLDFRKALARLKTWPVLWAAADTHEKNELLRKAGVRVVLGRLPGEKAKRPPMRLLSITAEDPGFRLALAVALSKSGDNFAGTPNAEVIPGILLAIDGQPWTRAAAPAGLRVIDGGLSLPRPSLSVQGDGHRIPPVTDGGPWLTVREFAERVGKAKNTVSTWVTSGQVRSIFVHDKAAGGRGWRLIHERELDRFTEQARLKAA